MNEYNWEMGWLNFKVFGVLLVVDVLKCGLVVEWVVVFVLCMFELNFVNFVEVGYEICMYFVCNCNVFVVCVDFGELYVDYYLYLSE